MKPTVLLVAALCAQAADKSLTFYSSFDGASDAAFAAGDPKVYTATSYRQRDDARPGIHNPDVVPAPGEGRFGDALRFKARNTRAIYYRADKNVAFDARNWTGTISFWLKVDPDTELAPGFCDPIQVTDEAFNDAAIWVDFTKDERPRHFRLGVFGELASWNPKKLDPEKNPDFAKRLVTVTKPPFRGDRWTHIVVTHAGLGGGKGRAKLYLDGRLQGATETIAEPFTWDLARAAIRIGVNYVGLFDELAVFRRELSENDVRNLHRARGPIQVTRRRGTD
ncbi:MAG: LamG-like jellyroll fold domain-containing protein [Bryobacteraceae bacterium]